MFWLFPRVGSLALPCSDFSQYHSPLSCLSPFSPLLLLSPCRGPAQLPRFSAMRRELCMAAGPPRPGAAAPATAAAAASPARSPIPAAAAPSLSTPPAAFPELPEAGLRAGASPPLRLPCPCGSALPVGWGGGGALRWGRLLSTHAPPSASRAGWGPLVLPVRGTQRSGLGLPSAWGVESELLQAGSCRTAPPWASLSRVTEA